MHRSRISPRRSRAALVALVALVAPRGSPADPATPAAPDLGRLVDAVVRQGCAADAEYRTMATTPKLRRVSKHAPTSGSPAT